MLIMLTEVAKALVIEAFKITVIPTLRRLCTRRLRRRKGSPNRPD